MSEIPEQFVAEARELLAAECEARGRTQLVEPYREGAWDHEVSTRTLARVLFERQQPTFEQRVEAVERAGSMFNPRRHTHSFVEAYDLEIAEIMRPKADPLVEAFYAVWPYADRSQIEDFRRALAARGLEIVAKGDA